MTGERTVEEVVVPSQQEEVIVGLERGETTVVHVAAQLVDKVALWLNKG